MQILALNSAQVEKLLDLEALRLNMRQVMFDLSSRQAQNYPRYVSELQNGALGFMSAALSGQGTLGYKVVGIFPANTTAGLNPHQGLVALLNPATGQIYSLQDGSTLTALRTAAVSAVATELLAAPSASQLALIGSGRQAHEHARALLAVRPLKKITIHSRSAVHARRLADRLERETDLTVEVADSPEAAVKQADIVVLATASREPLVSTLDFKAGTHVNAIGACRPGYCELDFRSRVGLRIFVDSHRACELESEELRLALSRQEIVNSEIISELGDVVADPKSGRLHARDVTVFKSVGLAVQDVAAAHHFYSRARAQGLGQEVDL
jgi:alanine dehydrogenase